MAQNETSRAKSWNVLEFHKALGDHRSARGGAKRLAAALVVAEADKLTAQGYPAERMAKVLANAGIGA